MAKRKHRSLVNSTASSATPTKQVIFFDENLPQPTTSSTSAVSNTTYSDLSFLELEKGAGDWTIFQELENKLDTATTAIVFTADRGKSDGEMPRVIATYQRLGKIYTITTTIRSRSDLYTAEKTLRTVPGFKQGELYYKKYESIHLSRNGKHLIISYRKFSQLHPITKVVKNCF